MNVRCLPSLHFAHRGEQLRTKITLCIAGPQRASVIFVFAMDRFPHFLQRLCVDVVARTPFA
jgi:hypothetical protein